MRHRLILPLLVAALCFVAPACSKKKPPQDIPTTTTEGDRQPARPPLPPPPRPPVEVDDDGADFRPPVTTSEPLSRSIADLIREGVLRTIYFAYDSSDLDSTSLATLRANAEWLKAYPEHRIVIQGHCDERGTIDYNLALGERRARSVKDHLTSLGVGPAQMRIVSYGEERPVDPGHTESAWSRNRRAEFVIEE